ncbi:MAG: peptide-methionine (S)-S-oxide reductase MsrA [Flavicella sp.]
MEKYKAGTLKVAYFASGCFWCVEAVYESIQGVEEAVSGYAGGRTKNPTYAQTASGKNGHAETVAVYYDPKEITFKSLIDAYYASQDPTTFGQAPDFGIAYRSIIFYQNEEEKSIATEAFDQLNNGRYKGKVVTEILPFQVFYEAESYHQNFELLNPYNRYIQGVSKPRVQRFKEKFSSLKE